MSRFLLDAKMPPRPAFQWQGPEDVDPCGNPPVEVKGAAPGRPAGIADGCGGCTWRLVTADPPTWRLERVDPGCKVHGDSSDENGGRE